MIDKKIASLEKRIAALEKNADNVAKKTILSKKDQTLAADLDSFMQRQRKVFDKGVFFSGLAIPSDSPDRLIRWSSSGGFKNKKEFINFLNYTNADQISQFFSNFSSVEKIKIIKILIVDEALAQKEILELTGLTQGQFYHHVKELIANKMVRKMKKDKYELTPIGHVIAMSFIGILNTNFELIK